SITDCRIIGLCRYLSFPRRTVCLYSRNIQPPGVPSCGAFLTHTKRVQVSIGNANDLTTEPAIDRKAQTEGFVIKSIIPTYYRFRRIVSNVAFWTDLWTAGIIDDHDAIFIP